MNPPRAAAGRLLGTGIAHPRAKVLCSAILPVVRPGQVSNRARTSCHFAAHYLDRDNLVRAGWAG